MNALDHAAAAADHAAAARAAALRVIDVFA